MIQCHNEVTLVAATMALVVKPHDVPKVERTPGRGQEACSSHSPPSTTGTCDLGKQYPFWTYAVSTTCLKFKRSLCKIWFKSCSKWLSPHSATVQHSVMQAAHCGEPVGTRGPI